MVRVRSTLVVWLPPEQQKGVRFPPRPFLKMKFTDIHCHLDLCKNIPEIIEKCRQEDIRIVTCGVDSKTNVEALDLAEKYPKVVKVCLGIYPLDALKMSDAEIDDEIIFIRENKDKIFGIGEVGLDLHSVKDLKSFERQKEILGKFVELARELGKPIFVHSRDAEKETIEFLQDFDYRKIVMHCFSGNMKLVEMIIENGWSLSIPATVKYNEHFQKVVQLAPIENLLCETDSPFLHPDKLQGMKNTPANVLESYRKIAEIKGMSLDEVAEKIEENYQKLL